LFCRRFRESTIAPLVAPACGARAGAGALGAAEARERRRRALRNDARRSRLAIEFFLARDVAFLSRARRICVGARRDSRESVIRANRSARESKAESRL
jgi:hypothetical protein